MKKFKLLFVPALLISVSLVFSSCGEDESLPDEEPESHEHDWEDATCTEPKTCEECGKTKGEALGHELKDATCTLPQICSICNAEIGEALGHQGSESSEWSIDYDENVKVLQYCCTVCNEIIELESKPFETYISGNLFSISPSTFANLFENSSTKLENINYYTEILPDDDGTLYYIVHDLNDDFQNVCMIYYIKPNGKDVSNVENYTEKCFNQITILIDHYNMSAIICTAILAIDPSVDYNEAIITTQKILNNKDVGTGVNFNGLNYLLHKYGDYHYLEISIK